MQTGISVVEDRGLESRASEHFGSAPGFMIVDTEPGNARLIGNGNRHHAHGMCQLLAALAGEAVEGIVVGGIGMGALMTLQAAGVTVVRAEHPTFGETPAADTAGSLQPLGDDQACGGHHGNHHA